MVVDSNPDNRGGRTVPPQVGFDASQTAHRLLPMAHDADRFGVALCGYLAEHLTVVNVLQWNDVEARRRCQYCAET